MLKVRSYIVISHELLFRCMVRYTLFSFFSFFFPVVDVQVFIKICIGTVKFFHLLSCFLVDRPEFFRQKNIQTAPYLIFNIPQEGLYQPYVSQEMGNGSIYYIPSRSIQGIVQFYLIYLNKFLKLPYCLAMLL